MSDQVDTCGVLAAVAQHALDTPDAVALEGAFAHLTYAALQAEASELAALLAEDAPAAIGLWMDNTPAWVVADLAAMQAWIPIVAMPAYVSPQQTGHLIANAGLELVMTDRPGLLRHLLENAGIGISDEDGLEVAGVRVHLLQLEHPVVCTIAESVARVVYRAGDPKGVCFCLHDMEMAAASMQTTCEYAAQDRHLCALPLAMLMENVAGVYALLLGGGTCVLPGLTGAGVSGGGGLDGMDLNGIDLDGIDLDGMHFLRTAHQSRISTAILTAQMLASLIAAIESGNACPAHLRHLVVVGRSIPLSLLQKAASLGLPVYAGYGRLEAAGVVAINTPQANRTGSAGQPLPHVEVDFSDDGEMLVRGALFSGYMGQDEPELVNGFWPSGDFGYLDEAGFLYLRGCSRRAR